jgi:4-amino-4-deoxy-L-arabinose transferase-like glycosyltransferase
MVAGLFVLSAVTRLAYLFMFRPSFDGVYWNLSSSAFGIASLSVGASAVTTDFEPLYPALLRALRLLAGDDPFLVQMGQALVASLGAVYLYWLGRALTGNERIGVIAAVLYALDPLLVRQAAAASDLALVTVLLLAFAFHFVSATRLSQVAVAGTVLGLAVVTRTMVAPIVIFAAAVLIVQRRPRAALVLATIVLIFVVALAARNWHFNGSSAPTRSGLALYVGNSPFSSAILPDHDVDILEEQADNHLRAQLSHFAPTSPAYSREANELLTKRAVDHMLERPLETMRQKALNVVYFFSPRLVPFYIAGPNTRAVHRDGRVVVEHPYQRPAIELITYSLFYTPILMASVWGVFLSRQDLSRAAILWCIVATFVTIHALYFPATRYRAPIEFVLLLYASVAIDHVARRREHVSRTDAPDPQHSSARPGDEENGSETPLIRVERSHPTPHGRSSLPG